MTGAVRRRGTTAVVPLRDGVSGKSRLAAVLDAGSRRRLVRVLARHVVETLLATDGIERVVVVTADPVFTRETLAGLTVEVLEQPADRPGLNGALEHAREVLAARPPGLTPGTPFPGLGRLLIAHADLPALTREDVTAVLAEPAQVLIATDRNRSGTNLLLLPFEVDAGSLSAAAKRRNLGLEGDGEGDEDADGGFQFRFGVGSLVAHLSEAEARGLDVTVVHRPGTAVDLDTADDWSQLPDEVRTAVSQQVPGLM